MRERLREAVSDLEALHQVVVRQGRRRLERERFAHDECGLAFQIERSLFVKSERG